MCFCIAMCGTLRTIILFIMGTVGGIKKATKDNRSQKKKHSDAKQNIHTHDDIEYLMKKDSRTLKAKRMLNFGSTDLSSSNSSTFSFFK